MHALLAPGNIKRMKISLLLGRCCLDRAAALVNLINCGRGSGNPKIHCALMFNYKKTE